MLFFQLKKEWFEKIKSGEKTIEYREVKPYWTKRIVHELFRPEFKNLCESEIYNKISSVGFSCKFDASYKSACILRLGYTPNKLSAFISLIEVVDGKNTDLHVNKPVFAFHLSNVAEFKWL